MLPLWNTLNDTNPRHQWIAFLGFVQEKLMGNKIVWVGVESGGIFFTFFCLWYVGTICKGTFVDSHVATNDYDSWPCQPTVQHLSSWKDTELIQIVSRVHFPSMFGAEELTANFSPRPLPRSSVWINRDRYLAFLNIWRLTDSAGAFDTWAPMFCEKPTIFWWSNTAGTSPYVLVETRSPSSGWNLLTSYVCLPEVYCNASCNCYDCYKVRFTLSLKEATKSSIRTWRTYSHIVYTHVPNF